MTRVLYVIEEVMPLAGGAHIATANLISYLRKCGYEIDVLSDVVPDAETRERFGNPKFYFWKHSRERFTIQWVISGIYRYIKKACDYPDFVWDPWGRMRKLMRQYDCVCVMSELSPLRRMVSNLPKKIRKIQMIHTDYNVWSQVSSYACWICKKDAQIYKNMDVIALIGEHNANDFSNKYPKLKDKVVSFKNLVYANNCIEKNTFVCSEKIKIVTLARCEDLLKGASRMVRIAKKLVKEGYPLEWTFAGYGYDKYKYLIRDKGLSDNIRFVGFVTNPSELLFSADLLALFSHCEGLPMVIYEAFLTGVPVACTSVGGMRDQVQQGTNGWLFADDEESILVGMRELLKHPECIARAKCNLRNYTYDNYKVACHHVALLGLDVND